MYEDFETVKEMIGTIFRISQYLGRWGLCGYYNGNFYVEETDDYYDIEVYDGMIRVYSETEIEFYDEKELASKLNEHLGIKEEAV